MTQFTDEQLERAQNKVLGWMFHTSEHETNTIQLGRNAVGELSDVIAYCRKYKSQVEEMQETLVEIANMRPSLCTWSDEEYYENFSKCEEIAQQTLQSLKGDKP